MSVLDTLIGGLGLDRRALAPSGTANPQSWLTEWLGGGEDTYSGKSVTPESSMRLVPVFSAVTLLSGAVASTPLMVYRRLENGRERASDHRLWRVLHEQPNEHMAADEFWEVITANVLLWGNGYAAKGRGEDGRVNELVPLSPRRVQVGTDRAGHPLYVYSDLDGKLHKGGPDDILHFRGLSLDGKLGLSPIQQARHSIGNALALEEFQGRFWRNNARPGGVLKHPGELSDKAKRRLRASWDVVQGGLANAGRTAILEEGLEWQSLGMPLADAQFIEQHRFGRSEVALLFRVPPYMLATETGGSLTYENPEAASLDFVRWSLQRWLRRHEGTLKRDPHLFVQGQRIYPEFLVDGLLRGDSRSRSEFYTRALDPVKGWLEPDEVRELENRNPLTDEQRAARLERAKAAKASRPAAKDDDGGDDPQEEGGAS